MSHTTVDRPSPAVKDLHWVVLDEDWPDGDTVVYGSIMELRTAPLQLSGAKADKFAEAKRMRVPRAARSLPLD